MAGVSSGENCTAWFSHKCQGRPITCTGSYGGNVTAGSNSYRRSNWRAVRWIVSIEDYDFEMEFRAGRQNGNADGITNPRTWSPRLKVLRTTTAIRTIYFCMAFKKRNPCLRLQLKADMIQSGASMSTITSRSSNIHHTFFEKERQALRKTARCQHARGGALIVYRDNGKERDAEIRSKVWI